MTKSQPRQDWKKQSPSKRVRVKIEKISRVHIYSFQVNYTAKIKKRRKSVKGLFLTERIESGIF
jgi:hypothetical protein